MTPSLAPTYTGKYEETVTRCNVTGLLPPWLFYAASTNISVVQKPLVVPFLNWIKVDWIKVLEHVLEFRQVAWRLIPAHRLETFP